MTTMKTMIAAAGLLLLTSSVATAQTADDIIQKHLTAIGGVDNWKKIKTMRLTTSVNAGGTEMPIVITYVHMKGMKSEFTMGGMTGYSILTPTKGWNYSPFEGAAKPEAMTDAEVKESQDELDIQGELIDYKKKGIKVTYLGKDDVEGTECYKLKLTYTNGKEETEYFDAATYYVIKSVTKTKTNGKESETSCTFGNYKKLPEGIVFQMTIENEGGGPMTVKSVEVNIPVDESIFQPKL